MPWWVGALIGCIGMIGWGVAYVKGYRVGYEDGYYNQLPGRRNQTPPKF